MKTRNHTKRKLALTTAALGLAMLLARESRALTITDYFTNAANWGTPLSQFGNIGIGGGHMNYTSASTLNTTGGAAIPRIATDLAGVATLSTTQDWSLKVNVHLDPFTLTTEGQFSDVFLGFGKTGDWFNTHVTFEFGRGRWGSSSGYYIEEGVRVGGVDAPEFFRVDNLNLTSSESALRMDYVATNHTLTYYFDADGPTGGYNWVAHGTTNLASGTYNLNLAPTDTFTIFLLGSSGYQTVAIGEAYLSNLEITVVTPVPIRPVLGISWNNSLPQLSITGDISSKYALDYVTSLAASNNWQSLITNTLTNNPLLFTDTNATGFPRRFYRARLVP